MSLQKEKVFYSTCQFPSRFITLQHNMETGYSIKGEAALLTTNSLTRLTQIREINYCFKINVAIQSFP